MEHAKASARRAKDQNRVPLSMRITPQVRRELTARAEITGRSITQEAERLMEQALLAEGTAAYPPEIAALAELLARLMTEAGSSITRMNQFAGHGSRSWLADPYAYDQAVQAAVHVLRMSRPQGDSEPWGLCAAADFPSPKRFGEQIADGLLETMRGRINLPGAAANQWTPRIREKLGVVAERLIDQPEPDDTWGPAQRERNGKPVEPVGQ